MHEACSKPRAGSAVPGTTIPMRITIVHNAAAGHDQFTADEILRAVERAGHHPVYFAAATGDLDDALRDPGDLVVAAGGDGTVRKIATRITGRGIPLTVLPMGTANNVARSPGIGGEPARLIADWSSWQQRSIDLGHVSAPWGDALFIEGAGFGPTVAAIATLTHIPAEPSPDGDPGPEIERDLRVLREVVADHPAHPCRIEIDGRQISGTYLLVEAMNIHTIGPNLELAPEAELDDGVLDLVLLGEDERAVLRAYLTDRLARRAARLDVPRHRGRHITITWPGSRVHVDDRILPKEKEAAAGRWWSEGQAISMAISVAPKALEVLVPADA
jgi:diacylglycerol kinase family enzyme